MQLVFNEQGVELLLSFIFKNTLHFNLSLRKKENRKKVEIFKFSNSNSKIHLMVPIRAKKWLYLFAGDFFF